MHFSYLRKMENTKSRFKEASKLYKTVVKKLSIYKLNQNIRLKTCLLKPQSCMVYSNAESIIF